MFEHVGKILDMATENNTRKAQRPGEPEPPLMVRAYAHLKIGDRCADVQKANDLREQKWKRMMDECKKDPEEYSPVALIPKTSTPPSRAGAPQGAGY